MTEPLLDSEDEERSRQAGFTEFGVAGMLAALGVFVLVETTQISQALTSSNPIGPRLFPVVIGCFLLVVAALLAVDIARGGHGDAEAGEDVDLAHGTDWATLMGLVAVVGAGGALIPVIGFPASGALLFFGTARLLGSRRLARDVLVSVAVPVLAFLIFTEALGVYLPAGPA